MTPVLLTPAIVAKAALAAYDAGTLCAQNTDLTHGALNFYRDPAKPGVSCAVGAALDDEHAKAADYPVSLTPPEVVTFRTQHEALLIDQIQEAHDRWASYVSVDHKPLAARDRFLELCRSYV